MNKFLVIIILILFVSYLLYTEIKYTEKFNPINDNNIESIQKRYDKFPLIQSEDLIITNTLNLDNTKTNIINFDTSYNMNIKNNNNNFVISSTNNKINLTFDLSGNCNISDNEQNQNQKILNTFVQNLKIKDLILKNKIKFPKNNNTNIVETKIQNNIDINNSLSLNNSISENLITTKGIRIFNKSLKPIECVKYTSGLLRICTLDGKRYGDIELFDENDVQYDSDNWIVVAVGHQFQYENSNATGVYTYIFNKKWYGSCSNQRYIGIFMAIPINYFEHVDYDSLQGIYTNNGYGY